MIPWALLDHADQAGTLVPCFLGEADTPWLRALIDAYERFVGLRRGALDEHLQAQGAGGTQTVTMHSCESLIVGPLEFSTMTVVQSDLAFLDKALGTRIMSAPA